jgi:hypothetical protein
VLTGSKREPTTISTVFPNRFVVNVDTVLGIVWNILPCWHRKKLDLGFGLSLDKDGFGKSMAAFASARSSGWAPRGRLWLTRAIRATAKVVKGTTVKAGAARLATATMGTGSVAVLGELGINNSGNHGAEF